MHETSLLRGIRGIVARRADENTESRPYEPLPKREGRKIEVNSAPPSANSGAFEQTQHQRSSNRMLSRAGVELSKEILEVPLHGALSHCGRDRDLLV